MWYYNNEVFTSDMIADHVGFVYLVTDKANGKKYVGKKTLKSTKTLPPLKGQKKKRKVVSESDWQDYYGSNDEIKAIVASEGGERFHRQILRLCKSKGEMSYFEMKEQIVNDVLLKPDEWYNAFVGGKIHRNHLNNLLPKEAKKSRVKAKKD